MGYLRNLFNEIRLDTSLHLYGVSLSLAYILTIFFWYQDGAITTASIDEPWCWPFYPSCWEHRATIYQAATFIALLGILAWLSLAYFICRKVNLACICLSLTSMMSLLLVIQDFRFRSNQICMLSWVTLVYLFAPSKRTSIPAIIIAFYLWAGKLKLNWEWISGSGLYHELWLIPQSYTTAACIYVILLQMILIWGLVSSRRWFFWTTLIQLVAFHIQSFSQIRYWYPSLMFLLLSFFVFDRIILSKNEGKQGISPSAWGKGTWVIILLFSLMQLIPIVRADTQLRVSSWRFFALHMFEAKYSCDIQVERVFQDRPVQVLPVFLVVNPKVKCDPVVYWNYARNRCREWSTEPQFLSMKVTINYRKYSDIDSKTTLISCDKQRNVDITYVR